MFAVIAFICGVVAAILKLVDKHANWILWLLIIGLIAVAVEGCGAGTAPATTAAAAA